MIRVRRENFRLNFPFFRSMSRRCCVFFLHQAEFNLVTLYSVTQLSWCHAVIFPRKTSHNIVPLIAVQHSIYITFDMKLLSLLYVRLCLFLHELCLELDVNMWDSSSSSKCSHFLFQYSHFTRLCTQALDDANTHAWQFRSCNSASCQRRKWTFFLISLDLLSDCLEIYLTR